VQKEMITCEIFSTPILQCTNEPICIHSELKEIRVGRFALSFPDYRRTVNVQNEIQIDSARDQLLVRDEDYGVRQSGSLKFDACLTGLLAFHVDVILKVPMSIKRHGTI